MPTEDYYDDIPENKKQEIAFNILAAVRESVSIAAKNPAPPTYEQSMQILYDIDPNLYTFCDKQLQNKNESELARYFKDRAAALTILGKKIVTPEQLLEADIAENKALLEAENLEKSKKKTIRNRITSCQAALESLRPRRLSEHRVLERDALKVDRSELGAEIYFETDDYIDYKLSENRYLRLRLLHPDKPESILGADLIYERYNIADETVRIAALQYKVWGENDTLYFSSEDDRSYKQMKKMQGHLCEKNMCDGPESLKDRIDYRFPYCSCFLRPTDRQQANNTKILSSGIHIPICSALNMADVDKKIVKREIRHTALTHDVFEHLFNHGLIGSRAIPSHELVDFYDNLRLFDSNPTLTIYAKEIYGKTKKSIN